jgi:hypothetical protein
MDNSAVNFHVEYMDIVKHWSPLSEEYCGGDGLLTALRNGWQMDPVIRYEDKWFAGMRQITVYHIRLHRNGEERTMRVLNNPYVTRMIVYNNIQAVRVTGEEAPARHQ